ncbi:uncharacterized protein LOC117104162 [Anneissia japonica]|uniref:uncharacterized protein LOC117104162 n=1 Tax=Anneissia japonica TaxID=1529436 RepID=UPI001425A456|nr:uncharacterized protein LOC117104162 [Anneissia japonica]
MISQCIFTGILLLAMVSGISGQTEGDVRLMPEEVDYNIVQVYHDNQWGAICSGPLWNRADGDVICRQLGRGKARYVFTAYGRDTNSIYNKVNISLGEPIWLADLQCQGNEDKIVDCKRKIEWGSLSSICFRAGLECTDVEPEENNYNIIGCYKDNIGGEPLLKDYDCNLDKDPRCHSYGCLNRCANSAMTVELCASVCCGSNYEYFGLEFRNECYCGHENASYYMYGKSPDGNCNTPCNGNASQTCGSNQEISLYKCGQKLLTNILDGTTDDNLPPMQGVLPSEKRNFMKLNVMYFIIGGVVCLAVVIIIVYAAYMRISNRSHMQQFGDATIIYCEPDQNLKVSSMQRPGDNKLLEQYFEAEYHAIPEKEIKEEREHIYKASLSEDGSIKNTIARPSVEPDSEEGAIGYAAVAADCMDEEYCVPMVSPNSLTAANAKKSMPVAPPRQTSLEKRQPHNASSDSLYAVPMKTAAKKKDNKIEYYATSEVMSHTDMNDESQDYRWMSSLSDTGYTKLSERTRDQAGDYTGLKD